MEDLVSFFDYVVEKNQSVAAIFNLDDYKADFLTKNVTQLVGISRDTIMDDIRVLLNVGKKYAGDPTDLIAVLKKLELEDTLSADVLEVFNEESGEIRYFKGTIKHVIFKEKDRYLLVWIDKTEEVTRNKQMEAMVEVAKSANDAKTSFLANMSHDFRTPMNAITNFNLLIAKNSENPQKVRDYTHKIGLACQNLLSLLNDVLDMSKIESGQSKLSQEEFALGLLLEEVNSVIAFQAKAKQQDYQIHSGGMQQDIFIGDKQRINEVLVNVLGNAVKYTPVGGTIVFSIDESKNATGEYWDVHFSIKDNGIGMSKAFQETIFDAFTREKKVEATEIQGTGLGMAIAKNLVEMMGGTINVSSEEGIGSTFDIMIRLQGVDQNKGDFWKNHGIHRILVIDNDVNECTKIETALKDTGVEVFFSTSGYKALHLIEVSDRDKKGFDVIILGMQIMSLSCFELAQRIHEKKLLSSPILLLLTEDWEEVADEARESGIYDFLQRPFFMSTFKQLIEDIVNRTSSSNIRQISKIGGMRLLAAEDNEINADILIELLNMEGAVTERAVNGLEAVKMFSDAKPGYYDAILMDIQMPVMDGYEATKAIRELEREDAREIPIIAMTANAFADDVQKALGAGMNAHVAKPIDIKLMEETIVNIIGNKRST